MAPEQLMGHAEPQSDIYSLAIIAVYLMSGVAPENLEVEDFHVLIDAHLEHLPHEITAFLRSMLEPKCENRMGDYEKIRQFFDAIRKQDFKSIPLNSSKIQSKGAKKYTLEKVTSYHQEGNIDLWQALPDTTPRKLKFLGVTRISIIDIVILFLFIISIVLVSIIIFIPHGHYMFDVSAGGLAIVLTFFTYIVIFALSQRKSKILFSLCKKNTRNFYKNARKSMATVVRIEYIPIPDGRKTCDRLPSWSLVYCFNPPDDSSPEPLVHNYITHAIPEDLKAGDLIPILYSIGHDQEGEFVQSMPYPIANRDKLKPTMSRAQVEL